MIDNRMYTFLELCNTMNYHKTAENLNMTQPAVTQHIKYLENIYGCKLFEYRNKKLYKTKKCIELEKYTRSIISLNMTAIQELSIADKTEINIGATKTIGEYLLKSALHSFIYEDNYEITLTIDNTETLLNKLHHFELDLVILEGYVDKGKYKHKKISNEQIVGICSLCHPFANKEIALSEIFLQNAVFREQGSGSRAVFENFLTHKGYCVDMFKNKTILSSNSLIEYAVQNNFAISFVYDVIPHNNNNLATFNIKDSKITHEFNYIFLNEEKAKKAIDLIEQKI